MQARQGPLSYGIFESPDPDMPEVNFYVQRLIISSSFFEMESHSRPAGWSAVVPFRLIVTFTSQVQEILLPQPPEQLGLQVSSTTPD